MSPSTSTSSHQAARTSLSHPLRIDEVKAGDAGGLIGITFCPGKSDTSLFGWDWKRDLAVDLDAIALWRPCAVVTLVEDHELELLGVSELGVQVRARGMAWHHLPIVDVQPPDTRFEVQWQSVGLELLAALVAVGRVLVHCRAGLGRAGTVAARLLVELGVPARDAIGRVRRARPGAIETDPQHRYVLNLPGPAAPGRSGAGLSQCVSAVRHATSTACLLHAVL